MIAWSTADIVIAEYFLKVLSLIGLIIAYGSQTFHKEISCTDV